MMTDSDKRLQIESALRRELTESELVAVPTLDELTLPQLQVLAELGKRDPISPSLYLQAVVPDASFKSCRSFVQDIDAYIAAKLPPVERRLHNEWLFETTLGRPLSEAERHPIATLDQISPEQRAAAAIMYTDNIDTAIMYIVAIASKVTAMMSEKWIIATFQSEGSC